MSRKTISGTMLTLLLISLLTLASSIQPAKSEHKIWYVDDDGPADFQSIQEAINSPQVVDGDTIFVCSGTYYEHLVVNKAISLLGETRDSTIINGSETDIIVRVRSDYVTITNFTIRNSRHSYTDDSAIHIDGHSHNIIKDNVFTETFVSIYLNNAHNSIICKNEIIAAFQWYTIWLRESNHNIIEKNLITNNRGSGISLWSSDWNTVNDNNVTGIPTLPTANGDGIVLYAGSHSNVVSNNRLAYNRYSGLSFMESEGNIVQSNIIESNYWGIYSWQSSDNAVYHNNFIANTHQAISELANVWDDGYPSGGNYWSDQYHGDCADHFNGPGQDIPGSDGIIDTPYRLDADNQDNYPLMKPWGPLEDATPPVTTISLDGTLGNNGWYTSDVTVMLSATDDISGVDRTEYSFDDSTWDVYDTPFAITTEGVTTVYYRSIDVAGNVETTKSETVKIDETAPIITISLSTPAYGFAHTQADTLTLIYTATDPLSGLASTTATLDDNSISSGESISLLWFSLGNHTIVVTAADTAGNTAQEVVTFEVIATLDSLEATTDQLNSLGLIRNQGIVKSLLAKLNVAQKLVNKAKIDESKSILKEDFIQQVQNLSGIHITPEAADILMGSAEYIISNL